jgi:hypothetical protein
MNDALYEQLVSCRTKPLYYILLGGAFLLAVLIAVLGQCSLEFSLSLQVH